MVKIWSNSFYLFLELMDLSSSFCAIIDLHDMTVRDKQSFCDHTFDQNMFSFLLDLVQRVKKNHLNI
jgi:hypothetical protein